MKSGKKVEILVQLPTFWTKHSIFMLSTGFVIGFHIADVTRSSSQLTHCRGAFRSVMRYECLSGTDAALHFVREAIFAATASGSTDNSGIVT